ncbi:recombinase family protein [Paramaledivibacter caminithermalis]|uniref:Site-specific DNA recombinase n=1 Tax=Paramaledivibacter caminithermalis (strain DSM 15212 / CIP 107654 / DViRD3) TaxID=1121301 RepID=A0A1M6KHL3_PARC5|nr:recombinase family protein [Paramaledivibacter caminithermalis]SHJ58429.1 Site-specific DNA recombinase [Paramaledivibacter caminithermalis DSM 15212]
MRCAVYVRVSTEMLTQKSSIAHQKNYFKNYIEERGWELYKIYEDIESGMSIKKRDGFKKLIGDGEKGLFDILLTKSISRFARNTLEGLKYIRKLKNKGIRFITIEDAFDSFEYDEFMFTLLLSMAQKESERISKRIKFGKLQRANKGLYNGSNAPYGYKKSGKDKLIPAQDITTEVVKIIFNMYLQGQGFYKIAKYLNQQGYPTPSMAAGKTNSNNLWHQSTIKNILTNEIYIGNMVQNRSRTKDLLNGIREPNLEKEYIRVNNTHEAIIDKNTFELVQRIYKRRRKKRITNDKHLFSNLLYCGECGSRLHYKKDKDTYICGRLNKMGKKYCQGCYVKEKEMKMIIEENLIKLIDESIDLNSINKALERKVHKKSKNDKLSIINKEVENMIKRKNRLLDIYVEGLINQQEYNNKKISLKNQLNLLQKKKKELEVCDDRLNSIKSYNELHEYIKLDNMIVNKLIKKIVAYNDGRIKVFYNFMDKNVED